jgi:hypothetical protein
VVRRFDVGVRGASTAEYLPLTFELNEHERAMYESCEKANHWLNLIEQDERSLTNVESWRGKERSRRWIANFDLLRAQLAIDRIRVQEYCGTLQEFLQKPQSPLQIDGYGRRFQNWEIRYYKSDATLYSSDDDVSWAKGLVETVIGNHPDTPWAYRIQREWDEVGLATQLKAVYGQGFQDTRKHVRKL